MKLSKQSFEKLLRRYQEVGALQKLTEDYEKKLTAKDSLIQKLKDQIKGLKDWITSHEKFLTIHELL